MEIIWLFVNGLHHKTKLRWIGALHAVAIGLINQTADGTSWKAEDARRSLLWRVSADYIIHRCPPGEMPEGHERHQSN